MTTNLSLEKEKTKLVLGLNSASMNQVKTNCIENASLANTRPRDTPAFLSDDCSYAELNTYVFPLKKNDGSGA